ncbi:hypothetical protein NA56DRAFT_698495 [Hyaloscypha hepaticicola]|uniref:Uncharacterized protein n=1 Tax=Hyaloscypha hepaticicola TaxID=2082293 RepID=A0A2J6QJ73_9HELO|nr:hypothetical protein NA56DRAFT_698495 [Hyaloscypha hepaticicola]
MSRQALDFGSSSSPRNRTQNLTVGALTVPYFISPGVTRERPWERKLGSIGDGALRLDRPQKRGLGSWWWNRAGSVGVRILLILTTDHYHYYAQATPSNPGNQPKPLPAGATSTGRETPAPHEHPNYSLEGSRVLQATMRSLLDWSKVVEVRRLENKSFAICAVPEADEGDLMLHNLQRGTFCEQ